MNFEIHISQKPIDGREIVAINSFPVVRPVQIHSTNIVFAGRGYREVKKGDAIVTDVKDLWIGVLTADCYPVFVVGKEMVGVIHAGWRGSLKGIVFKTLKYLQTFTIIEKTVIGPGICGNCYEVGLDLYRAFPKNIRDRVFFRKGNSKFNLDLKEVNKLQINSAGITEIEDLNFCTVCDNDRFFSFRKEKTDKRILSAIRMV